MHYVTFDGLNFNLLASCNYILVHDLDHLSKLDVILRNDHQLSFNERPKRSVDVMVDNKKVHLGSKRRYISFSTIDYQG